MKVIKIPYDTAIPCTVHEVPEPEEENCLEKIKELISIEWAEIAVTIMKGEDPRREYCLILDEVGKLKDGWRKRINTRASQWYAGTVYGDPIVGDVVFSAREWTESFGECDLAGLEDWEVTVLLSRLL